MAGADPGAPDWLEPVVGGASATAAGVVTVACAIVLVLSYAGYRRHGVDVEVKREMLNNLLVVGAIALATVGLRGIDALPYWAVVAGGVAVGFAAAVSAQERLGTR